MSEETFLETLARALEAGKAEVEAMARKKMETKWSVERLRALAYVVSRLNGAPSGIQTSFVAEALACAADEIERMKEEAKWTYVRAAMRRNKGGVSV